MFRYSPDVEVPARTTRAPEGGDVREAARTVDAKSRMDMMIRRAIVGCNNKVEEGRGENCGGSTGVWCFYT